MSIDERIDERTLREIDFPQFEAAIKKAPQRQSVRVEEAGGEQERRALPHP
jgi:beta-glucosidase-like glycosyl hydrolase